MKTHAHPLRRAPLWAGLVVLILLLTSMVALAQSPDTAGPGEPTPQAKPQAAAQQYLPFVAGSSAAPPIQVVPPRQDGSTIPGQYIVMLKPAEARVNAVSAAAFAQTFVAEYGGDVLYTYDAAIEGFAATLPDEALDALRADPDVALIEGDQIITIYATQTPAPWGLDRIDQRYLPLSNSYTYNGTGAGVHMYIIDTGVRGTHQEFTGRMGGGYTVINDGYGTGDCHGHGTHVAGIAGGTTYGVAKGVTIHPVRVLGCTGSGTTSGVIAGVDWVTLNSLGPAVANMSLGGAASTTLDTAVQNSINSGVTYVIAAGNSNANACNYSPARLAPAITVGATASDDTRSSFSNFGSCLDLFAPGSAITSAYYSSNTATATLNGTSMAAPHVAGVAALYLEVNPTAQPLAVRNAIVNNATTGVVVNAGSGSPNLLLDSIFGQPQATPTNTPIPTNTPTPTRTPVPTNTPTPNPVATNTPTPTPTTPPVACTNRLANGDFESGRTGWVESSKNGYQLICTTAACAGNVMPRTGVWNAWLGGGNSEISEIRQVVTLPAEQTASLGFYYWLSSTDYCGYDYGYVNVIDNGVTTQIKRYSLCTTTATGGWRKDTLSLSSYAGKTVTLVFRATTDSSLTSHFFVDDALLLTGDSCVAAIESADAAPPEPEPFAGPKPAVAEPPGAQR